MKSGILPAALLLFLFAASNARAESHTVVHDIRYLGFDKADNAQYTGFDQRADWSQIDHWATNRGLSAVKSREPYLNNRAVFVSQYGSGIRLTKLNPNTAYSLFIDFVVFKGGSAGIVSRLVISANGRKLASINFGDLPTEQPYELIIPREIYVNGAVDVHFDEYATTSGVWGIWDCILSTDGLPKETVKPKKKTLLLKEPTAKIAEPKNATAKKTVGETPSGKNNETETPPPVKKKEPAIIEPEVTREPEIKQPEMKEPSTPKGPAMPEMNEPDIRDGQKRD
jgi:hypothetical protein